MVTGNEFLLGLAAFAIALLPGIILALCRTEVPDKEPDYPKSLFESAAFYFFCVSATGIGFFLIRWEGGASFFGMLGGAVAVSFPPIAAATLNLLEAKFLQIWLKPHNPRISVDATMNIFALFAAAAWGIMQYGEKKAMEPAQANPPPPVSAPAQPANDTPYRRELSAIEAAYPAINPDSPAYDRRTVDAVFARLRRYQGSGFSDVDALRAAISDVFHPSPGSPHPYAYEAPTTTPPPPKSRPSTNDEFEQAWRQSHPIQLPAASARQCEYRAVMSAEDLRACGIKPQQ